MIDASQLSVSKVGDGVLTVASASDDADWLTLAPADVGADGLGTYEVSVDRSSLAAGTYSGTLSLVSSSNTVNVPVVMNVGNVVPPDAGFQIALLVDSASSEVVAVDAMPFPLFDGVYPYAFPNVIGAKDDNVLVGRYLIVAGTDNDNDGFICDAGEACGAYPVLDLLSSTSFGETTFDLDFDTSFPAAIDALGRGGSASTSPGSAPSVRGFRIPALERERAGAARRRP